MIFIPFKTFTKNVGGPSTFMKYLREHFISKGYAFIEEDSDYRKADKIFYPISYDKDILGYFKSKDFPVIQRLDGVFYPSKHGLKYLWLNRYIKRDYFKYSDFIIFQSEYSRTECFTIMGRIPDEKYSIIYNGADKSIFYPASAVPCKDKFIFAATGSFRNKDMIEPVVNAMDILSKKYPVELRIIGPIVSEGVKRFTIRPYIKCLGKLDKSEIGQELRNSHILVHCQLNPACPNSVIEALSCGIPVVGFDTGAMKEVLYFAPELLAYVSDEVFKRYRDFSYLKLLEKMENCIENYDFYKKIFYDNSALYDVGNTCNEYLKIFDKS